MMPVKEVDALREEWGVTGGRLILEGNAEETLRTASGDLMDAEFELEMDGTKKVVLDFLVKGIKIEYDAEKKTISLDEVRVPLDAPDGKLKLRILIDVASVELFAQDGEVQIAKCFTPKEERVWPFFTIRHEGEGGKVVVPHRFWVMKSIWDRD